MLESTVAENVASSVVSGLGGIIAGIVIGITNAIVSELREIDSAESELKAGVKAKYESTSKKDIDKEHNHHIVPKGLNVPRAVHARFILNSVGINPTTDEVNKVMLHTPVHRTIHRVNGLYCWYVDLRVSFAYNHFDFYGMSQRDAAYTTLHDIGTILLMIDGELLSK